MIPVNFSALRERLGKRTPQRVTETSASQAAVALVLVPTSDDVEALFIRRAEFVGDPWSGHIALPGGRRHHDDADLLRTAIRETFEETGVILSPDSLIGELDEFMPLSPRLPRIVVRPFVFGLPERPPIHESDEVAAHLWLGLADLRKARTSVELEIGGAPWKVDAFVIGSTTIWGLTERIIHPFIELAVG